MGTTIRTGSPRPVGRPAGQRRQPRLATLVVAAALVAAVGAWGVAGLVGWPGPTVAAVGETFTVGDLQMRVDRVSGRDVGHTMPGMTGMDVPDGHRPLVVEVSLHAAGGQVSYAVHDFTIQAAGQAPLPATELAAGTGHLARGMSVSGSVMFLVPGDATELSFRFRDGPMVALDVLPGPSPHGH